jgi:hypothetical protein
VNLKHHASLSRHLFEYATDGGYKCRRAIHTLSLFQLINLSLSKLSPLQRMASNDNNGKCKLEEEAESLTARKRLWVSDDDLLEEETKEEEEEMEEEVYSEETSMSQLDTSKEKL